MHYVVQLFHIYRVSQKKVWCYICEISLVCKKKSDIYTKQKNKSYKYIHVTNLLLVPVGYSCHVFTVVV